MADQMAPVDGAVPELNLVVWPTHIGFSVGHPGDPTVSRHATGEPIFNPDYRRGQIQWAPVPNDAVLGGQEIVGETVAYLAPTKPGEPYTHLVYFCGDAVDTMVGCAQLDHPIDAPVAGPIPVGPIRNGDQLLVDAASR